MAHDIFISYSSKDKNIVDALVSTAENNNIRCWYAPRDIASGDDWGNSITKAISNCKIMVIVFSNHSNTSRRVLDEVNFAITENKIIIPFRVEKIEPTGAMKLHLSSVHWLDAFQPSWKNHINELILRIEKLLDLPNIQSTIYNKNTKNNNLISSIIILSILVIFIIIFYNRNIFNLKINQKNPTQTISITIPPTKTPTPEATNTPENIPILSIISDNEAIRNKDDMEMILIPEGEVILGNSSLNYKSYATDEHEVYLSDYWIDKYPVTKEQYAKFFIDFLMTNKPEIDAIYTIEDDIDITIQMLVPLDSHVYYREDEIYEGMYIDSGYSDHPITDILYGAASLYCNYNGARLPTEAEWEKAARGTDNRPYPWGFDENYIDKANINNQYDETTPVGQFVNGVSPYGVYDLVGNVYEWTSDWFDLSYYINSPYENPQGPEPNQNNTYKTFRGSSWGTELEWADISIRNFTDLFNYSDSIGFRCAMDAE